MLIRGDARALPLRDTCVDCVVTSPPYWGLRTYGDDRQLGLEPTPEAYVATLVQVFREVRRVLRDTGTLWLNLGDSYAGNGATSQAQTDSDIRFATIGNALNKVQRRVGTIPDLKPKNLVGIPWRVAFALQRDGWCLRSDIIWAKPNPMPESVTDRPTKAHEYLFLLSKRERYYYDADSIRESAICKPSLESSRSNHNGTKSSVTQTGGLITSGPGWNRPELGRNKRTIWQITTEPYSGAHFATFPEALVEPCILAGCPLGGRVLDPFCGTGTVLAVAARTGRRGIGVDLTYQTLAAERTAQRGLPFADAVALTP